MPRRTAEARQPLAESFADAALFFRRFLRDPKQVASVLPSSRYLAAAMFADLALQSGDVIVEYGPGTGAFTREVQRLRRSGLELRYLGIERDPGLYQHLCRRFPELDFQLGDVCDAPKYVRERGLDPVKVVISGLPLMLMPPGIQDVIFAGVASILDGQGVFRTFSYVNNYPTIPAVKLRRRFQSSFKQWSLSRPVLRNLPPAFVLSGRGPVGTDQTTSAKVRSIFLK